MALALIIGMAQCNKNKETSITENEDEMVFITLDVNHGSGSRLDVNPPQVIFQDGDMIYVASTGRYVGHLVYNSASTSFGGSISGAAEGQPLYFYLLGNVIPSEALEEGVTTSCSVSISDQTSLTPVIACAPSNENFSSTMTSFTSTLRNKCALVKFNVTTSSEAPTCIKGFNNKMTVSFAENTLTPTQEGEGVITLPSGNGEKWAVLLPQGAMEQGGVGSAFSADEEYSGTLGAVPEIFNNSYYSSGISVVIDKVGYNYVDLGLPSGTLWAVCNVGADTPEGYGDYFAWGETQPKNYYDWPTYQFCRGASNTLIKYCNNSGYGYNSFTDDLTILLPEDDAATTNWGMNWRMPTVGDWQELLKYTTSIWTQQNGVKGRLFTATNGSGNSVFLPAAGYGDCTNLGYNATTVGRYWSNSLNTIDGPSCAIGFNFDSQTCTTGSPSAFRDYGRSVRAVHVQSQK